MCIRDSFLIFKKGDFYDASEKDKPGKNKKSRDAYSGFDLSDVYKRQDLHGSFSAFHSFYSPFRFEGLGHFPTSCFAEQNTEVGTHLSLIHI